WLSHTSISDLAPLASLTALTNLDLDGNFVTNCAPLAGLTNLVSLDLSPRFRLINLNDSRPDFSVSCLAQLTRLVTLNLRTKSIHDISALAGLTNLQSLILDGAFLHDCAALSGLVNLTNLGLASYSFPLPFPGGGARSGITNVSCLAGLQKLRQ